MSKRLLPNKFNLVTITGSKNDALYDRYGTFLVGHCTKDELIEDIGYISVTIVNNVNTIDFFNYHPARKVYQYTHSMKKYHGLSVNKELDRSLESLKRLYSD